MFHLWRKLAVDLHKKDEKLSHNEDLLNSFSKHVSKTNECLLGNMVM